MTNYVPPFITRLGLDANADERAIKKAYARELKLIDQEKDLAGFQALRESFEQAKSWAQMRLQHAQSMLAEREETICAVEDELPGASNPTSVDAPDSTFLSMPEPIVLPVSQIAAPTPPSDMLREQEMEGEAAFSEFLEAIAGVSPTHKAQAVKAMHEQMEVSLNQPCMVSIAARTIFEHCVADYLARGWQPGNEVLFNVATTSFQWDSDAKRLEGIPHSGRIINAALENKAALLQLPESESSDMIDVLQRLRYGPEANAQDIVVHMYALEAMERRFPSLLHIVANPDAAEQWHELAIKVPSKKRKVKGSKTSSSWNRSSITGIGFIVWIAFRVLTALFSHFDDIFHHEETPASSYTAPATSYRTAVPPPVVSERVTPRKPTTMSSKEIRDKVAANIIYRQFAEMSSDRFAQFNLELNPEGQIDSLSMLQSSGDTEFDNAVMQAIKVTLPKLFHGDAPTTLTLSYSPQSLNEK